MSHAAHHGPRYQDYLLVFGALIVMTAGTVAVAGSGLGAGARSVVAFSIATVKAFLVVLIFMHLKFERRFLAFMVVAPVLLVILFIVAISPDVGSLK